MYTKGLVSVIIPTYKRSIKLSRAIDSVLNQTYKQIELLVVNDNNPDDEYTNYVLNVTRKYNDDPRFKLIIQEKHINGAVARNIAIKKAKGEFIAFLDDDDWWELDKLEYQVATLSSLDNSWGGVSCKFRLFDINENVIGYTHKYNDGYIYKDILAMYSDVATGTLLLRHSCLDQTGYFDEKLLRNQDIQLLAEFTFHYKLMQLDKYLHCVDVSDAQNRVSDEKKLLKVRKALYESIQYIIDSLSESEFRKIDAMRDLELGYILIRNKKYVRGLYYTLSIFKSFGTLTLAIKKLKRKAAMKKGMLISQTR